MIIITHFNFILYNVLSTFFITFSCLPAFCLKKKKEKQKQNLKLWILRNSSQGAPRKSEKKSRLLPVRIRNLNFRP